MPQRRSTLSPTKGSAPVAETSLYAPLKHFFERAGYFAKGEVGGCDIVALSPDEDPSIVIVEMKLTFNLELILQAVDRAAVADEVWIAGRTTRKAGGREADSRFRNLCRRLGFGMLGVSETGEVDILVKPCAPTPRRNTRRRSRLVTEHQRRQGDPSAGGGSRSPIMTAYRQRALACAAGLASGLRRPRELKGLASDAGTILLRNVYGWFVRESRGFYSLTSAGRDALLRWPQPALLVPIASVCDGSAAAV
jgi:hypothetical protein